MFEDIEGDAWKIRKEILTRNRRDPEGMKLAFAVVMFNNVEPKYRDFIKGLDDLNEKDRGFILEGFLERANLDIDQDQAAELGLQVLKEHGERREPCERREP